MKSYLSTTHHGDFQTTRLEGGVLNFTAPDLHECNSCGRVNLLRFV